MNAPTSGSAPVRKRVLISRTRGSPCRVIYWHDEHLYDYPGRKRRHAGKHQDRWRRRGPQSADLQDGSRCAKMDSRAVSQNRSKREGCWRQMTLAVGRGYWQPEVLDPQYGV